MKTLASLALVALGIQVSPAAALGFRTAEPPSVTVNLGEEIGVLIHPPDNVEGADEHPRRRRTHPTHQLKCP